MSVVEISARNRCLMKKGIESEAHFPLAQGHNCPFEGQMIRTSVATDSPVNSLSSDDFLAILDAELDSASSDQSPDQDIDANEDNDVEIERIKRRKVSEIENGEEVQSSSSFVVAEEEIDEDVKDSCPHPGFLRDMCICCGKRMEDSAGVAFGYIHKDLRLGSDEISRLRNADVRALLRGKKLYLVLDLDQTLLNSTRLEDINAEEEYLKGQTDSFQVEATVLIDSSQTAS